MAEEDSTKSKERPFDYTDLEYAYKESEITFAINFDPEVTENGEDLCGCMQGAYVDVGSILWTVCMILIPVLILQFLMGPTYTMLTTTL